MPKLKGLSPVRAYRRECVAGIVLSPDGQVLHGGRILTRAYMLIRLGGRRVQD